MACGIQFAYIGNVPGNDGENTYCPSCKKLLIRRRHYETKVVAMDAQGRCSHCQEAIPGIWTNKSSQ